jgi:predicted dehydrogenase
MLLPARVWGDNAPSKRITLGFIGLGSQGCSANLTNFLGCEDAHVVAVCDVVHSRAKNAKTMVDSRYQNTDCKIHTDFRKILEDLAIDAVVISTPDHWHVPMSLMALEAGKDVFCEKPTKAISEGRLLIEAVAKRKAVFQMGMEDRSLSHYHMMVEWLRNGAIGDLQRVDLQLPAGNVIPRTAEQAVPEGVDYNLFVGPAEFIPFRPVLLTPDGWRMVRNFGGGSLIDWGSHLVDTAQLAVNAPEVCPVEVEGTGEIPRDALTTVPVQFNVSFRYSTGVVVNVKSGGTGIRLTGSKGWVGNESWRGKLLANDEKILHAKYPPGTSKHWKMPPGEQRNFIDCVKSRQPTTYPADTMHLLHTTLLMGDLSIRLGRKLRWDAKKEEFINDAEANTRRSYTYRDWAKV